MVHVAIDDVTLADYCRRWQIVEFALFGSVVRQDFRPESDVDVLVSFAPSARHGLLELSRMEEELSAIIGRKVDLVERVAVERSRNYLRRAAILESAVPIYAA